MKNKKILLLILLAITFSGCNKNDIKYEDEYITTVTNNDLLSNNLNQSPKKQIENENIDEQNIINEEVFNYEKSVSENNINNSESNDNDSNSDIKNNSNLSLLKSVNFQEINEIVYATCDVNIRELPSKDSNKYGLLRFGEQITRTGVGDNGWSRVIYNDNILYINSKFLSTDKPILKTSSYIGNFIQKSGNVDNVYLEMVSNQISKIPEKIISLLTNNDSTIYVTDENLALTHCNGIYSSLQGVTIYDTNTILIEDRKAACVGATVHECGHLFDKLLGFPSIYDNNFISLYEIEKDSLLSISSSYSTPNTTEYFAELFDCYIKNRDKLKEKCPNSFSFIENKINSL